MLPAARLHSFALSYEPALLLPAAPRPLTQRPVGETEAAPAPSPAGLPALTPAGRRGLAKALSRGARPAPAPRDSRGARAGGRGATCHWLPRRGGFPSAPLPPPGARAAGLEPRHALVRWRGGPRGQANGRSPAAGAWARSERRQESPCPAASGRREPQTGHWRLCASAWGREGGDQLPRREGCSHLGRHRPAARALPTTQPPPRAASPPSRGANARSPSQHGLCSPPGEAIIIRLCQTRHAPRPGQSRAGGRARLPRPPVRHGPHPRGVSEARFLGGIHSPSPEPPLRNSARERSARAALLPLPPPRPTAPESSPLPRLARPPVFKGTRQTCWRWVIEKLL